MIIVTAALIPDHQQTREFEYRRSLNALQTFGLVDYKILECCLEKGPSFLEDFGEVYYSNVNDSSLRNKGVNEARALLKFLEHLNLPDDEFIVKLTGRYILQSPEFFKELDPSCDAVVLDRGNQIFYGCLAIKNKIFIDLLRSLDLNLLEKQMINIEKVSLDFLRSNNCNIKVVPFINIFCNIAGLERITV